MTTTTPNPRVPTGRYIVRYVGDQEVEQCVAAIFQVSVGSFKGEYVHILICSRKAAKAVQQRSAGWLEWMAYDGDGIASKILDSTSNAIGGHFYVEVEGGHVKRTMSPTRSESTFKKFMKELAELWALNSGPEAAQKNLEACKLYQSTMGLLPCLWGDSPGEKDLRRWLDQVADPSSDSYVHDASTWLNKIYVDLGGVYESVDTAPWPLILKNIGFDRPPKRPRVGLSGV